MKLGILGVLSLIGVGGLVMFAVQNATELELLVGPYTITTRRITVIAVSFAVGFIVATFFWWSRR